MKLGITLFVYLTFSLLLNAEKFEPYLSYIKERFLDIPSTDRKEIWYENEYNQPNGGYLFRFFLDVTQDEVPELFLTPSKGGGNWRVYKKNTSGNFEQIADNILPAGINGIEYKDGLVILNSISGTTRYNTGFTIHTYSFSSNGNLTTSSRKMTDEEYQIWYDNGKHSEEAWNKLNLGKRYELQDLQKILLAKYIKNPNTEWKPFNNEFSIRSQQLDPADKEDLKLTENFSPEEAKRLVEQWQQKETETKVAPKTSSISSNQTQTNLISQTTLETKSSKQVIIWGIIAILGLGLIILFILKRKPEL